MKQFNLLLILLIIFSFQVYAQDSGSSDELIDSETVVEESTIDESDVLLQFDDDPNSEESDAVTPTFNRNGTRDIVSLFIFLIIVIGIIILFFWLLKKITVKKEMNDDLIKVIGSQSIRADSTIHIIEVGEQVFLIGAGNSSVSLITELTDKDTVDAIKLKASQQVDLKDQSFFSLIRNSFTVTPGNKSSGPPKKSGSPFDFLKNQKERLKKL